MKEQFSLINAMSFADGFAQINRRIGVLTPEDISNMDEHLIKLADDLKIAVSEQDQDLISDDLADIVLHSCLHMSRVQGKSPHQIMNKFLADAGTRWKLSESIN